MKNLKTLELPYLSDNWNTILNTISNVPFLEILKISKMYCSDDYEDSWGSLVHLVEGPTSYSLMSCFIKVYIDDAELRQEVLEWFEVDRKFLSKKRNEGKWECIYPQDHLGLIYHFRMIK
mmetsp:Transcript_29063/g.73040  ORF Transcript_29063/g.73040 Transcript_29063/m.73040 type:complete len:120 (+) Transcript_29063:499-858(+)